MSNKQIAQVLAVALCVLTGQLVQAQVTGQEWIDFNKTYYKMPVAEAGVYRISYDDLQGAGVPVGGILPARYQLYHRGEEQAIMVSSVATSPLQPGDFIEFYGRANDGTLDRELYAQPELQPHPYVNLFSDTTAYFITWSQTGESGKRMVQTNLNSTAGLSPESYYIDDRLEVFAEIYSRGNAYGSTNEVWLSTYDAGEGYTSTVISNGESRDHTYAGFGNLFTAGVSPQLEIQLTGNNNQQHNTAILVGADLANLRQVASPIFSDQEVSTTTVNLQASDFNTAGEITVRVSANSRITINYIRLLVPRSPVAEGTQQNITLRPNPVGTSWLPLSGLGAGSTVYDISDPNNVRRIGFNQVGTTANIIADRSNLGLDLLLWEPAAVKSVRLQPVTFRQFDPTAFNYIILSHPRLRQPAGSYADPVQAYADYRASAAGGSYQVLQFDMPQLYDQFSYGEYSAAATYRLLAYMVALGNPEYLLLIGKGVDHVYSTNGINYRTDPTASPFDNLVPTGGFPGSDAIFTAGLAGSLAHEPAVPTGRINAFGATQVAAYLDKVKAHEQRPFDDLRRKQVLHLSGGLNPAELNTFKIFVDELKVFAEAPFFGGQVTTISKRTNANVELINISEEVNNGLSLITFFGHSSTNFSDIDVGFVSNPVLGYNNPGKYPLFIVNGCNAGNIFSSDTTFGEDWVLAAELGAIGFVAHTGVGFPSELKRWSDFYYNAAFNSDTFIDLGIGDVHKETGFQFDNLLNLANSGIAQIQQTVLQGDPAVRLFGAGAPDYALDPDAITLESLNQQMVTAQSDSFALAIVADNLGRTTADSISLSVNHIFPDGQELRYDSVRFAPILFRDTLLFTVRPPAIDIFGVNRFEITIDYDDVATELDESNNTVVFTAFLTLNGTTNLIPEPYAVVDSANITLIAQLSNLEGVEREVALEFDTVSTFNSPFLQSTLLRSRDLLRWSPTLLPADSTVYYWRSRLANPQGADNPDWVTSSFTYIADAPRGWGLSHRQQWEQSQLSNLIAPGPGTDWDFVTRQAPLIVETFGGSHPNAGPNDISFMLDDIQFVVLSPTNRICRNNTIAGVAIDRSSLQPYPADPPVGFDLLDPQTCGRTPQVINHYTQAEIENNRLRDYIDGVQTGDQVILFNIGEVDYSRLTTATLDRIEQVGGLASDFLAFGVGEPFILIGRKGDAPGTALMLKPDASDGFPDAADSARFEMPVTAKADAGTVISPLLGPALSWNTLVVNAALSGADVLSYDVLGIDTRFTATALFSDQTVTNLDITGIDPQQYPFIQLRLSLQDEATLSPPDLRFVQASYLPLPEGILLRADEQEEVSVSEGEPFSLNFRFENISGTGYTDSIPVTYSLLNTGTRNSMTGGLRLAALATGQDTTFTVGFNTLGMAGSNDVQVFANEAGESERSLSNNLRVLAAFARVEEDRTNPLLDVRIDGRTILDGEIVSPSPLISVLLRDENEVLRKEDTTGVTLFIKPPCENCDFEPIFFSNPLLSWSPATAEQDFEINYQPQELVDGVHTFRVQGTDASGNLSGTQPYQVNFEVVSEAGLTNFYPYPNPFSTSTRFVFTLTGTELPDQLRIRIMTVTGKVVREVFLEELGPIRIGNNLTDFAWDGRDAFGDQLANGVYLYQVDARINGEPIELRSTAGDRAFKNGIGKVYLLR